VTEIDKRVRQTVADVLGVPGEDISLASSRTNTPEWDSLKHIEIIMAIESEFDVRFSVDEIEAFRSCGDIVRTMQARL
jgi:acyl carrier protein